MKPPAVTSRGSRELAPENKLCPSKSLLLMFEKESIWSKSKWQWLSQPDFLFFSFCTLDHQQIMVSRRVAELIVFSFLSWSTLLQINPADYQSPQHFWVLQSLLNHLLWFAFLWGCNTDKILLPLRKSLLVNCIKKYIYIIILSSFFLTAVTWSGRYFGIKVCTRRISFVIPFPSLCTHNDLPVWEGRKWNYGLGGQEVPADNAGEILVWENQQGNAPDLLWTSDWVGYCALWASTVLLWEPWWHYQS